MAASVDRPDGVLAFVKETMVPVAHAASRDTFQLVNAWTSRTASLFRVRIGNDGTHDVVVKVLKNLSHAAALVPAMNELAALMSEDRSGRFHPLATLGYSADLGGVVMPYVEGPSLERMIAGRSGSGHGFEALDGMLASCGRLLAQYHTRYADESPARTDEARRDLDFRSQAVPLAATIVRDVKPSIVSRAFGDFHAGHIIVGSDGQLTVLDPGIEWHYSFGARDMACFLDRMLMTLLNPRVAVAAPFRIRWYDALSAAFVRGYSEARPDASTGGDRIALDICLAFRLKRRLRSLMRRRPSRLLYYAVPLACQYQRLTRRLAAARRGGLES